jgi:hypothetical protein
MVLMPLSTEKCIFSCWFGATPVPSDLLYILILLPPLSYVSLPYTYFSHSKYQISYSHTNPDCKKEVAKCCKGPQIRRELSGGLS